MYYVSELVRSSVFREVEEETVGLTNQRTSMFLLAGYD
jgi:hypothetical protein